LFLDKIIKEIPTDHTYYQECVNELILVFREANDSQDVRKDYTPDPLIITHNLQEFVKRWRDVIDDKIQAVLTENAITLLTELEQHVQTGCLSAIPPEVGDENFNEIHNALRKSVSSCRITVPLVSALFSMCLHEVNKGKGAPIDFPYNSKKKKLADGGFVGASSTDGGDDQDFEMLEGFNEKSAQTESTLAEENIVFPSLTEPIYTEPQKIIPAAVIISTISEYIKGKTNIVSTLLTQALMYYKYQEDFDAFAPQAIQNLRLLPYYSSALNLISHPAFPREIKTFDTKTICHGLLLTEQKIRRLHVDVGSSARLTGTTSDIFTVVSRQLQKDKMSDNLAVDVMDYMKYLLATGVQLLDMRDAYTDMERSLKSLVNFKSKEMELFEETKKQILGEVNKSLQVKTTSNTVPIVNQGEIALPSIATNDKLQESNTELQLHQSLNFTEGDITSSDSPQPEQKEQNTGESNTGNAVMELGQSQITQEQTQMVNEPSSEQMDVDQENKMTVVDIAAMSTEPENESDSTSKLEKESELPVNSEEFDVLKALADKLGAVITLFTDLDHCWVIPIFPDKFHLNSPHFFVVYRFQRFFAAWLGSKASVSSIRSINFKRQGKEPQCRCGRGTPGKTNQGRCVSRENGKYLTRCICFRLDRGCSDKCDCRGCDNPFGKRMERPRMKKPKIPYRQRYAHEAAKIATCKSSTVSTTVGTQTPSAQEIFDSQGGGMESWVPIEHCIFEALINEIKSEENVITPDEVQLIFNQVVKELTTIPRLEQAAFIKSTEQISLKLQQREKDVSDYLRIYQMQVDLSLG